MNKHSKNLAEQIGKIQHLQTETMHNHQKILIAAHNREITVLKLLNRYRDRLNNETPGKKALLERRYEILLSELEHIKRVQNIEIEQQHS